jgi:hypothetical protein
MPNKFANLTATCTRCKSDESVVVPLASILLYKSGALIQKAFPHEDADTREVIMASLNNSYFLCPTCWDTQFPEEA